MDDCAGQLFACGLRVTVLFEDGVPEVGSDSSYTTDALVILTYTPVYAEGTEIEIKNACDTVCLNYKSPPSFKRGDVELTICTQDPRLVVKLGAGDVLTDGGVRGYADPAIGRLTGNGISIELWALRISDGLPDADYPYARHVFPRIVNLKHGVRTFNGGEQLPVFSGEAYENPNWFDGPFNDWPVASDRVHQWFPDAALPEIACGPIATTAS